MCGPPSIVLRTIVVAVAMRACVAFANVTSLKMSSMPIPKSILFWICAAALLLMAVHYFLHAIAKKDNDDNKNRNLGI